MAWQEPKTDWKPGDPVNISDWQRITGNIEVIQEESRPVGGVWPLAPMKRFKASDIPYAEDLNAVEENYSSLARRIYPTGEFLARHTLAPEGRPWDDADLNRIESLLLDVRPVIQKSMRTRPTLSFVMGGGAIASLI